MNVDASTITVLSICSGIGGLELGVRLVLPNTRTICFVERDIPAAQTLARRMDDGALDAAPIWSDVTRFDGERWAGAVDIVMGGIPCQPFSVAGQRKGQADERWIWPDIWRWVRDVQPGLIFLENVPGFIRHGLPVVLGDLAEAGFAAEWGCFSAADVGAPHRRERVFVLAHAGEQRREEVGDRSASVAHQFGAGVADPDHERCEERQFAIAGRAQHAATECGGGELADAGDRFVPVTGWGAEGRDGAGPAGSLFPPGPADRAGWAAYTERGGPEPAIRRGADGTAGRVDGFGASRNDRLHALGNAVVPQCAAVAFATLYKSLLGCWPWEGEG